MLIQVDTLGFLLSGILVGLISEYFRQVETNGELVLLSLTAIGFAALAVELTALTIFVSFVNDSYLRVLTMSARGGLAGYVVPYLAAALISTATTTFGVIFAIVYGAVHPAWAKAVLLGLEAGLVVWSAWAVYLLVVETSVHGLNRFQLARPADWGPDTSAIFTRERERSAEDTPTSRPEAREMRLPEEDLFQVRPGESSWQTVEASGGETSGFGRAVEGTPRTIAPSLRDTAEGVGRANLDNIRTALQQSHVYALGESAGTVEGVVGAESVLLHLTIGEGDDERVILPVFTGIEAIQIALLRNPDWRSLSVLSINGAALIDVVDPDVHIVIDPWTEREFQLPSRNELR